VTATARKTLKPADDKPFDFNLDAVEDEVELLPWRVHHGGRRWVFKHPEEIDAWGILTEDENNGDGEITAMIGVFKVALGEEQFAEFRKVPLPMKKLKRLFEEYQKHGGVEPGESQGSTAS